MCQSVNTNPPTVCRYERERGTNRIQILTRLVPNIFHEGYTPAVVETLVDRMRANVYTLEAPEPLDLLQLIWWDLQVSGRCFLLASADSGRYPGVWRSTPNSALAIWDVRLAG